MSKWKKVALTLVGLAVACTAIGVMTGNACAAPPVIVLDPGHSGTSVTTIDPETLIMDKEYPNTPEMEDVFAVATILKAKLEADGYTVLITKQAYPDTVTKRERVDLADNNHAALAVSIHTSGSTFGHWGQIYVQRLDGYREDICGNQVYFNLPAIASLSQQYGQIFLTERRKIEGDSIVVTVDSFDSRDLAPGNLPIVQLWSTVPWIYCEAGALQSDNDRELYAQSLYNSIVACVPITGATPPPVPAEPTFRYEETAPSLVRTGAWTPSSTTSASGGSFSCANASGASVTIPFTGTYLAWIATTGPAYGLATVTVDGVWTYTVDLYSEGTVYTKMVWNTGVLPSGSHRVKITWTGAKNPSATGTYISLDALEVAGGLSGVRYEQPDHHIVKTGTWYDFSKALASGGSYGRSNSANASATIYFTGTRLDWIAMKGTTTGVADVYLDGAPVATINLASSSASYNLLVWSTGVLPYARHKVQIVPDSLNASTKFITLDAVDVVGTLDYAPPTITSLDPSSGSTGGGTSVTIIGTGFSNVSAVTFDGIAATSYVVNSSTAISAVAPVHAAGTVRVQVTAAGGSTANTSADDFAYTDVPLSTRYEQTDEHIVKTGTWSDYAKTTASGGSYGRSSTSGASATIYFTGTRLDWIAMKGTTTGLADVYVDGVKVTTGLNLAATSATYQVDVWSTGTLSNGAHNVKIVRSASSASGKYLTLDAVDIWGTISVPPVTLSRYEQTNTAIVKTGTWANYAATKASGGTYGRSSTSGATAAIKFIGTRLDYIAMKGTTPGYAEIWVDGVKVTGTSPINLYSSLAAYQQNVYSTGTLAFGLHTVKIVRASASAAGKFLTLDAVDVWGWIAS
jgi:IPT/TIG domain/N-acetylmuramoyl-L-alanine amidase